MSSSFIDILIDRIKHEYSLPAPATTNCTVTRDELTTIQRECTAISDFDTGNLRSYIFNHAFVQNRSPILCKQSIHGKIIVALESETQTDEIPWDTWFRILRLFYSESKITVVVLARTVERIAPLPGKPIRPEHINGGYTYACHPDFICVYRAEDATRVLIHELFHAHCADNQADGTDVIEAKTEAWAEIVYSILLGRGNKRTSQMNLLHQSEWMHTQNRGIQKYHLITKSPREFPWRYTIGKEQIFREITHITADTETDHVHWKRSLRLTPHPSISQKRLHGVSATSTML
jgi:hypothetical protein